MFFKTQRGSALVLSILLAVLLTIIVSAFIFTINYQKKTNLYQKRYDRALWIAETGVNRFISGLKNSNDTIYWNMPTATPTPPQPVGYWLDKYLPVRDEQNKKIGEYKVVLLRSSNVSMTIKAYGKAQESDGTEKVRIIGVRLDKFHLGAFAIASNHQVGGAHINGGTNVHGGIFTSGRFHLDSASCGIYNDYNNLNKNLGAGYTIPSTPPNTEVFIYKDLYTNPQPSPNGVIEINNSTLGTSSAPVVAIHTENDSTIDDPGDGSPNSAGDGIIGNGQSSVYTLSKDHDMPSVNFPDVSPNSPYVQNMYNRAVSNGNSVYTGDVTLNGATNYSIGAGFNYNKTTNRITLNDCTYIQGNLSISGGVTYTGKGVIVVVGNVTVQGGLEPVNKANFPSSDAIAIIATGNSTLGVNTGSTTVYAGYFWGNTSITIQKANIYGSIMGNTVNLPTTGTRPEIYIRPDLVESLNVPLPDFSNAYVKKTQWWEIFE